jgi:hypothetical protein
LLSFVLPKNQQTEAATNQPVSVVLFTGKACGGIFSIADLCLTPIGVPNLQGFKPLQLF